ncbi:CG33626, partial [Drosophila busckii]
FENILIFIYFLQHKNLKLHWDFFDCKVNTDIAAYCKCHIVAHSVLSVEIKLLKELASIQIHTVVSTKQKLNAPYRTLFENSVEGCRVIADAQRGIVRNFYKTIVKSSNQPRKCPVGPGLYYFYNTSVGDYLPDFLPKTEFKVQLDFFTPTEMGINITLVGRLFE